MACGEKKGGKLESLSETGTASIRYRSQPKFQQKVCGLLGALTPEAGSGGVPIEIDSEPYEVTASSCLT